MQLMSKAQEILDDVILAMPYNNAQALFEKDRGQIISKFGGSCRHQLMEIASRLRLEGVPMNYLRKIMEQTYSSAPQTSFLPLLEIRTRLPHE